MAAKKSTLDKLTDAMMALIATHGWPAATLDKIADAAGVSLYDMAGDIQNRFDLLDHFGRTANARALKISEEEGGSQAVRDKLFSVLMARFDVVLPHKAAIRNLRKSAQRDPGLALYFAKSVPSYLSFLLEASGVSTASLGGCIKARGFTALYLKVVQVWLDDETEDQAKTMAAVDKMLADAENWGRRMEKGNWKFWQRTKDNSGDMRDITPSAQAS